MLLAVTFLYTESPIHPTNHYNVLFLMNLHSPSKSNTNSTQILGFILIRLSFTIGHFHTRTLQKTLPILFFFIRGSVFSDCAVFYGDTDYAYEEGWLPDRGRCGGVIGRPSEAVCCRSCRFVVSVGRQGSLHPAPH